MRPRLKRVERRLSGIGTPWIALLIWAVLVGSLVVIYRMTGRSFSLCTFRAVSGIPCPSCGSTRAVLRVLDGDLLGGFLMNPLVMLALTVIGVVLALRLLFRWRVEWNFGRADYWILGALLLGAVAANWIWVIRWHATP